jgi:hypothetical protein
VVSFGTVIAFSFFSTSHQLVALDVLRMILRPSLLVLPVSVAVDLRLLSTIDGLAPVLEKR